MKVKDQHISASSRISIQCPEISLKRSSSNNHINSLHDLLFHSSKISSCAKLKAALQHLTQPNLNIHVLQPFLIHTLSYRNLTTLNPNNLCEISNTTNPPNHQKKREKKERKEKVISLNSP